jgi:large subunit ribosomal protein L7/L12
MANLSTDQVIEYLSNLSVMDIAKLTKSLEEKWGVKAAPAMVAGPAGPAADAAPKAEEKTEFTVVLKAVADATKKVGVIKVVKEATGVGLMEAKQLVEGAPKEIKAGLNKADADALLKKLTEAGATAELT